MMHGSLVAFLYIVHIYSKFPGLLSLLGICSAVQNVLSSILTLVGGGQSFSPSDE